MRLEVKFKNKRNLFSLKNYDGPLNVFRYNKPHKHFEVFNCH